MRKEKQWESAFDNFNRMEVAKSEIYVIELGGKNTRLTQTELEEELERKVNNV